MWLIVIFYGYFYGYYFIFFMSIFVKIFLVVNDINLNKISLKRKRDFIGLCK